MNKAIALLALFLSQAPPQMPKNNPNGVWESVSGTQYEFKLNGSDLSVRMVAGSNPTYVKYEVELKQSDEVNTYEGKGFFIAKVKDKECRFETDWRIVVVTPDRIIGAAPQIIPDPDTCGVKERNQVQMDLKKK
jgi:hypothetical protein